MRVAVVTLALAVSLSTLACAQLGGNAGPTGEPGGQPPGSNGEQRAKRFHVLPPQAQEQLNLSADQRRQVADLETQVTARMQTILTAEQLQKWARMRPPPPPGQDGQGPSGGARRGGDPGGGEDPPNP